MDFPIREQFAKYPSNRFVAPKLRIVRKSMPTDVMIPAAYDGREQALIKHVLLKSCKRATAPPLQRHLKRSVSAVLTGADDDWVSRETGTCAAGAY